MSFLFGLLNPPSRMSRERLNAMRDRLLVRQIRHACATVPFYNNYFTKNGLTIDAFKTTDDLNKLPVINKEMVRADYSQFLSRAYVRNKCLKSHTSGSTGAPFDTYFDRWYWLKKKYLAKLVNRMECGYVLGERLALFECEDQEKIRAKNASLGNRLLHVRYYSIFEPLEKIVESLKSYQPVSFYGYPGFFFRLAQHMERQAIKLKRLKRVFTSSEYLEPNVRSYVAQVFGADVFDSYGSNEFKEVSWECDRHEGYHINEHEVIVEILKDGKPARDGEAGRIVITDLLNRAMPLIRYDIQDQGMLLPEQCGCGRSFRLMRPLSGRASDYLLLPDGTQLSPYRLTTAIEHVSGLLQYQFYQKEAHSVTVRAVAREEQRAEVARRLEEIVSGILGSAMRVSIEFFETIQTEENGKSRVIKSEVASCS